MVSTTTTRTRQPEALVRVTAPRFCAGIVLIDDLCTDAAPILRWAIGKRADELRRYFASKGWKATVVR